MPYNGSGLFTLVYNWEQDALNGINVRADRMDVQEADVATALSNVICKDGQQNPTANLPMATFRHTGVGNGVARTDYNALGQAQDHQYIFLNTIAGSANAITANCTPVITAYISGAYYIIIPTANNSGATTINLNGLGVKTIKKNITVDLETGDLQNGQVAVIVYDGTNFQLSYDLQNKNINMNAKVLKNAEILAPTETSAVITASSSTVTLDLSTATFFDMAQSASITTLNITNPGASTKATGFTLKRTKDNSGTSRTITWPASIKWAAGSAPTLTQSANAVDMLVFVTIDNGTTYDGFIAGLGMA